MVVDAARTDWIKIQCIHTATQNFICEGIYTILLRKELFKKTYNISYQHTSDAHLRMCILVYI